MLLLVVACIRPHRTGEITGKEIVLSLDDMLFYPEYMRDTAFNPKYKYVVYVDSVECSPCKIAHMGMWNYFKNELYDHETGFYMIFFPSKDITHKIMEVHTSYRHRIPIYIDTLGLFERYNPQIAEKTTEFHSFLLDENNRVVVVGDASVNNYVRDEIYRILSVNADDIQQTSQK